MRLRLLCAATLAVVCLPSFATPAPIGPGQIVTPGTGSFGGSIQDSITSTNTAGTVAYSDTVYADPNNPFCNGCYDFVIGLQSFDRSGVVTSVTTANFNGNKYMADVAYTDEGADFAAPFSASENAAGTAITFDLTLFDLGTSDPMIIYTNAMGDKSGTLTIATERLVDDPPAFAPSGPAVAPEPSSLLLLGTGALGLVGTMRRRLAAR